MATIASTKTCLLHKHQKHRKSKTRTGTETDDLISSEHSSSPPPPPQPHSSTCAYSYGSIEDIQKNGNNVDEIGKLQDNYTPFSWIKLPHFSCCSLKMPTAARQAFSFVANLFGPASTSTAQVSTELNQQNGKTHKNNSNIITDQPNGKASLQAPDTVNKMTSNGSSSPTESDGSSDVSDESILSYEPSSYEKEIIKKTWSDDFDFLYELGASIYDYIFANNPNTKQLFPSIHRHGDKWKESKEFRSQALKFVQTISHTVKNLYHMDRLAPYLYKIGELHVKYAQRGFKPEFWNSFLDAMEIALTDNIQRCTELDDEQKIDAVRVWRRLSHYIISHMKRGYNDELKRVEAGS